MKKKCWEIWYDTSFGLKCGYIFAKTKYIAIKRFMKRNEYLYNLNIKSIKEVVL